MISLIFLQILFLRTLSAAALPFRRKRILVHKCVHIGRDIVLAVQDNYLTLLLLGDVGPTARDSQHRPHQCRRIPRSFVNKGAFLR